MTPELKQKLGVGAGILVFAFLGYSLWAHVIHRNPNSADFPDGTYWTCSNGHHFNMTMKEYGDYTAKHYGEPMVCPKCNAPAQRAIKCAKCGEYYPMQREGNKCPKCGTEYKPPD